MLVPSFILSALHTTTYNYIASTTSIKGVEAFALYSLDVGAIIHSLCFSPNRYWLCAATENSVKIWDLESKSIVQDLKPDHRSRKNQMLYCTSLNWSEDGNTLFTGYSDGTIRIWGVTGDNYNQ